MSRNGRLTALALLTMAIPAAVFGIQPASATTENAAVEKCASGRGRAIKPDRVRHDRFGGTFYDYTIDGVTMTSAEAPAGMDPSAASDEELARYGLPPRPSGDDLAPWLRAMRSYRSTASVADPHLCVREDLGGHTNVPLQTVCTGACGNYAGRWGTHGNYTAVTGNTTVPAMSAVGNCTEYGHISAWVGIGGVEPDTAGLLQAGTITELYPNQGMVTYAFYEWVAGNSNPNGPSVLPIVSSWNALPGHEMYERVQVNTSSHGVNFYVQNVSTGQHLTMTVGGIYADYDPRTAGWIVENHTVSNQTNIKTGPWYWTNALATRYSTTTYGGSTQSPGASTGAELWPAHPSYGHIVQTTSPWSNTTSFASSWQACR